MEKLSLLEIKDAVSGEIIKEGPKTNFQVISTDTRTIEEDSLFIALKGEKFNGNLYIKDADRKGAALCVIDELHLDEKELCEFKGAIIKVKDTKRALMDLATYYRNKLNIKIIGITGSTGKTSTKDLTAAALSHKYKVFKTKGNFNNEIGLPLMMLSIDSAYDVAVLEMGMSNFGEIHNLASIAKPDIALITNIGVSHLESLKTRENILKAKMEITDFFSEKNILIVNGENDLLSTLNDDKEYKIIKIGTDFKKHELNYIASDIINSENSIKFNLSGNNLKQKEEIELGVPGMHNVLNGQLAIGAALELGVTFDEIREGFKNIESTSMRLEVISNDDIKIINDAYNASPDSMRAAIDYMNILNGKRKIAILGTMKELGDNSYELHKEVAEYAKNNGIDMLLCVGEFSKAYEEGFGADIRSFENNNKLSDYYKSMRCKGDLVLVKASRSMKFENIVKHIDNLHN